VGGVPTSVHDFALSHRGRLRGVFTDATHFALSPAAGQLDLSFVISQGCIDPCPDEIVTVHKTNFQPITGALDLVAKTISFNVNESAGSDGVSINFGGAVTAVPPDTDHDGVFDGADNCPLVSNPTQQRVASPKLTAPPGLNVTTCSGVALGTPTVTDICGAGGVVVSNNAPAVFPLGKTVVTWTARDARGNAATATQTVTATLGDSATCCPSGTHVIMGTAGADRIDGTEGADCILGLGGDDRIDGRGGSDFISGGAGRDTIQGGFGNDVITGGDGDDTINAGPDDDTIDGGPGTDTCDGSSGHNTVIACEVIAGG
ncbi:MAG TPA: HYR domain-containing protein, partial [Polyangia bacterium]|nr:HYR domain-containing protein [Polyangia bacterium]